MLIFYEQIKKYLNTFMGVINALSEKFDLNKWGEKWPIISSIVKKILNQ